MTTSIASIPGPTVQPAAKGRLAAASAWTRAVGWAMVLAGASLVWLGSWPALLGLTLALAGTWAALGRHSGQAEPSSDAARPTNKASKPTAHAAGRHGSEVMVSEVVPVWSRQMEVTGAATTEGLGNILNVFSNMSDSLHTLTQNLASFEVKAEPGAVDQSVRREAPALDALTGASARAFSERDAAVAELTRCADALGELQQLAKQAREIARHTRLVAFNASIEANRSRTATEGGAQAVAVELRSLATRMSETGDNVERVVLGLLGSIRKVRRQSEVSDTTPEELRLEIDLRAREALGAMLGAMGASLQGSDAVQQASQQLREQLDEVFVQFQFGDRVSQMLNIVANDMSNFARWVQENPRATQSDAAEWLAALEASYTMDEQRSIHHGNVHVDKTAAVEFF
jgi:methyl-accepting chemotaxis protein